MRNIDSPFMEQIVDKKDKLVKIRKKIYKYLQKQNKNGTVQKEKIDDLSIQFDVLPILKKLELPLRISKHLEQMPILPFHQLNYVEFPQMMELGELQMIANKQQAKTLELEQKYTHSYTPSNKKPKRLADITNTQQSIGFEKCLFSDQDNMQMQQISLAQYKIGKVSRIYEDIPLKLSQFLSQRQYFNDPLKQKASSDSNQNLLHHNYQDKQNNVYTSIFK